MIHQKIMLILRAFLGNLKKKRCGQKNMKGFWRLKAKLKNGFGGIITKAFKFELFNSCGIQKSLSYYENLQASEREQLHLNQASILS
jgi:hypothetical protein